MTARSPSHPADGATRSRIRLPLLWSDAARCRWAVASRALAAIVGGYVLSALCSTALAMWLPLARAEAVITGTLASFAIYAGAVMWVFAARSAGRAWAGIAVPAAVLGAALWLVVRGAAQGAAS
ncbi:DUF3649 domain-containing protein [Acidovorax sp. Leaf160]|uniref:DUF3649 domain-containing protein n=1 Tax=Acidovorax sp. Leaf160 TaxID=1736280 RepID=UPI0006F4F4A6|nr:DUF3649 domain-containing protein [Acidovorax sp. Leaf160]KQR50351.1 hypothetical protein ASF94_07815 [Acidovorax sp. Leaf160]